MNSYSIINHDRSQICDINISDVEKPPRAKIELGDVTPHNVKQLKTLNTVVFPVSYNEKFYKDVLEVGELAKLAYYNDIVVGAVCCRVDTSENSRRLYIMTLGCLSPYRRLGVGTVMVEHVLRHVEKDGNYDNVYLHVQVNNTGAIDFYKKFGFEIHETKKHYYKRIEPADAHVLQKNLRPPALTNGIISHNERHHHNEKFNHHDKKSHDHNHHNDKHLNERNSSHHHHHDKKNSDK
ncbi:N-alpha-acetyltransferase 50 isoform X2 [Halyomorpha halys]|uniref:N-alpha-acetyltransferase 50 isoform X2 n=1 Tax=Halyomorpha halys TaxID=286706 RepID=UPI0006D522A1|nr:N-alpha-acetyltransferase 50 isoform X2 [Halyomorpha halys]